ncbi:hypothetical protein GLYMA_01G046351v4 [Glycine max]|nr:hypothetical protein GLYMA_01G046351v4 [Glycine max]KAH1161611.1 hypothetical protein GYH30_000485 [Glycine max]
MNTYVLFFNLVLFHVSHLRNINYQVEIGKCEVKVRRRLLTHYQNMWILRRLQIQKI